MNAFCVGDDSLKDDVNLSIENVNVNPFKVSIVQVVPFSMYL